MRRTRRHLTYANVVSTLCLVLLVGGGTALARTIITKNNQVARGTISGHHPPTGAHPNIIKNSVGSSDLSGNFEQSLRLRCPSDMELDDALCYEVDTRPDAKYNEALRACALDHRRLPDAGELALVYDHLSANQAYEWTVGYFTASGGAMADVLGQNSSRVVLPAANTINSATPFRCVSSASD